IGPRYSKNSNLPTSDRNAASILAAISSGRSSASRIRTSSSRLDLPGFGFGIMLLATFTLERLHARFRQVSGNPSGMLCDFALRLRRDFLWASKKEAPPDGTARPSLLRAAAFYERASYVAGSAFLPNFSLTRRRYRSFVPSIPHMAKRSCYPSDESNRADKQPRRRHKMGDGHCDTALFGFGASQARNIAWFRIVSAWSAAAFFWRSSSLYSVSKSISLTMAMLSSVSMSASVTRQGKSRSSTARSSHAAMRRSVASVREHISVLQCGERLGGRVAMVARCLRSPGKYPQGSEADIECFRA